jgi:hypothetical protein
VQVLKNNGGASFTAQTPIGGVGDGPSAVTMADMNADGLLDVVVASFGTDNVSVLLNNGTGGLLAPTQVAAGAGPRSVAAADVDDDGDQDLILANIGANDVVVLRNQAGSFGFAESSGAASFASIGQAGVKAVLVQDLDGDGLVDAAAVQGDFANGTVLVLGNSKAVGSYRLRVDGSNSMPGQDFAVTRSGPEHPGDYDGDMDVDGHDFLAWQRALGSPANPAGSGADGDASGTVGGGDLPVWRNNFGTVYAAAAAASVAAEPESTSAAAPPIAADARETFYSLGDFTQLFADARSHRPVRRSRFFVVRG